MSLLVQLAKDVGSEALKKLGASSAVAPFAAPVTAAYTTYKGVDKGMRILGEQLAKGTAVQKSDRVKSILDNLVHVTGGSSEYLEDYAYFERTDWTRALALLDATDSGRLTLIETSSAALPGREIIVFSKFEITVRGASVAAKLQKISGKVPSDEMAAFIETVVRMAEKSDASYREMTSATRRVHAE